MTSRLRADKPNQHWSVAGALAGVLAVLMLSTAPAGAQPTAISKQTDKVSVGVTKTYTVSQLFTNAGTNPKLLAIEYTSLNCCYKASLAGGSWATGGWTSLRVTTSSSAELRGMSPPPPNPFTVTADVSMINDEGQSAVATLNFETHWDPQPPPAKPAGAQPTPNSTNSKNAPPDTLIGIAAETHFDDAGTNPRITSASYSTTEYYTETRLANSRAFFRVKTNAQLKAMNPQPADPFTVTVTVTMTNDEGQTASRTIDLVTDWDKPPPANLPVLYRSSAQAPPGVEASAFATYFFNNAGTNPKITSATFSTTDYYVADQSGVDAGILFVRAKTNEELRALDSPPADPFTVTVTVTMTNDEGQTASGDVSYVTNWIPQPPPTANAGHSVQTVSPGTFQRVAYVRVNEGTPGWQSSQTFDNVGTNPRFTNAVFSTMDYYVAAGTGIFGSSRENVFVQTKTNDELRAMSPQPPNPFTVTADVTMTNDEGHTATTTVTINTTWFKPPAANVPTSRDGQKDVAPGEEFNISVAEVFANAGTAGFTHVTYSTKKYFQAKQTSGLHFGWEPFSETVKTNEQLNAMDPRPPNPFTVTANLTMRNVDPGRGQTATGTFTLRTSWTEAPPPSEPSLSETSVTAPAHSCSDNGGMDEETRG